MKLTIVTDLHLYGPHALMTEDEFLSWYSSYTGKIAFLGDNFEVKNCPKDKVGYVIRQKEYYRRSSQYRNDIFLCGNHSLNRVPTPDYHIEDGYMFVHGDIEAWGREKSNAFRSKKAGAGWFKRNLIVKPIDSLRWLAEGGVNDNIRAAASRYKKEFGIHTLCMGHRHPASNIVEHHDGVKIVIFKRGIQTIDLGVM